MVRDPLPSIFIKAIDPNTTWGEKCGREWDNSTPASTAVYLNRRWRKGVDE